MATDTGSPSGADKAKEGTGIPQNTSNEEQSSDPASKYIDNEDEIADGVRILNPNRNVDKEDATGAGGYRN